MALLDEPTPAERRADRRHASLMALVANVNRDPKKRPEAYTASDFLPEWNATARAEPSDEELLSKAFAVNAALGGTVS